MVAIDPEPVAVLGTWVAGESESALRFRRLPHGLRKHRIIRIFLSDLLWPSLACFWHCVNPCPVIFPLLMPKQFFIGVDGGATSCRARIRDMEGNLLGEGAGGPANIHSDLPLAKESIRTATKSALSAAGLDEGSLKHAPMPDSGLAGAGLKTASERLLSELPCFASVELETDAYVAWLGAHKGSDGGIVILGTGSCGLAIVKDRCISVAGWGPEVSDEAGGQRMGREALRRTLWTYDGRAEEPGTFIRYLTRFNWEPAKIVTFAARASSADYAVLGTTDLQMCLGRRRPGDRPG